MPHSCQRAPKSVRRISIAPLGPDLINPGFAHFHEERLKGVFGRSPNSIPALGEDHTARRSGFAQRQDLDPWMVVHHRGLRGQGDAQSHRDHGLRLLVVICLKGNLRRKPSGVTGPLQKLRHLCSFARTIRCSCAVSAMSISSSFAKGCSTPTTSTVGSVNSVVSSKSARFNLCHSYSQSNPKEISALESSEMSSSNRVLRTSRLTEGYNLRKRLITSGMNELPSVGKVPKLRLPLFNPASWSRSATAASIYCKMRLAWDART